ARQPVFARGRVKTPSGWWVVVPDGRARVSAGRSTIAIGPLLQRLEVGDEGVDLLLAQVQVRHAALLVRSHGLLLRRVAEPLLQVGPVQLLADLVGLDLAAAVQVLPEVVDGAGEHAAAGEVGEV